MYRKYAKTEFEKDKCIISLEDVDSKNAVCLKNEFYISIKNDLIPKKCVGGTIEEYETKKEFKTYKVTRINRADRIEISL